MGYIKTILLPRPDKQGLHQVKIEYRHPGRVPQLRFSTGIKVRKKDFNESIGRIKNNDASNLILDNKENEIKAAIHQIALRGIEATCTELKRFFENNQQIKNKEEQEVEEKDGILKRKLTDWFEIHLKEIEKENTFYTRQNSLRHFAAYSPDATLEDLDYNFFSNFIKWCENKGYKNNTIYRDIQVMGFLLNTIRVHCRKYKDIRLLIQDIREEIKETKIKQKYAEPVALDLPQFLHLLQYDQFTEKQSHLELTRDNFILGICIGGLRIEDYLAIKQDDVWKEKMLVDGEVREVWLCNYYESKNSKLHNSVPILSYAYPILEKYDGLPHRYCANTFNPHLKELAEVVGFTHLVEQEEYDRNGKLKEIHKVRLCNIFSSRFMRKVRVTLDTTVGISENISRLATGHQSQARKRYEAKTLYSMLKGNQKHEEIFEQLKQAE